MRLLNLLILLQKSDIMLDKPCILSLFGNSFILFNKLIQNTPSCKILHLITHLSYFKECYKFGNFRENYIFPNSVKRYICDVKNLRLGHELSISLNDRVICDFARILFSRDFAYAKFCKNKTLAKISGLQ